MDLHYQVVAETCFDADIGEYLTYGIQAGPDILLHDISTHRQSVEQLARLLTERRLDPIHLKDVVEDWLP